MKVYAIIPSGGKGVRASSSLPKQYIKFYDKEIIAYTLEVFQKCELVNEIVISAQKEFFQSINSIKEKFNFSKLKNPVEGGTERQYSVFNAVKSIQADKDDIIIIHDAVRPLLPLVVLENSIKAAMEFGSAVVAIKAKDTLISGEEEIEGYLDRNKVFYVQTPQVFRYSIFIDAMIWAEKNNFLGTDESMLVHQAGHKSKIVAGSSYNFKITSDEDLKIFSNLTKKMNGA
jgi:2-C-methyl-D-erythritol 4-phosphate cytidylyltransferase